MVLHLALPLIFAAILKRSLKEPAYRKAFAHRLGMNKRAPHGAVWVFAASLGETRAVSPLIRLLITRGHHVILNHSSAAGLAEGQRLFADELARGQITHGYVALDLFWAVRLFLRRNRPALGLVVEAETWPGMLMAAHKNGLPMIKVNGNLTRRAIERNKRRFGGALLKFLSAYQMVLTKSEDHRQRYLDAGVPADRIHLVGEMKFDQEIDADQLERADAIRREWRSDRPVFMIASSVEDEEESLLQIVRNLAKAADPPRVIWVPRSPQRFSEVTKLCQTAGYRVQRRSECLDECLRGKFAPDTDIFIGDSLVEMNFYYQMSDLIFVGASLVNHGGHNIVEPLALGRPVVVGPSIHGITFPAHEAIDAGACISLPDAETVADVVAAFFNNPRRQKEFIAAAQGFNAQHKGAARATLQKLLPYLPDTHVRIRPATLNDSQHVLSWRNDPVSVVASINQKPVSAEAHKAWYSAALEDQDRQFAFADYDGKPAGVVRFDRIGECALISIALAPEIRGLGLAKVILSKAIESITLDVATLLAKVRSQNAASLALFDGLGFERISDGDPVELKLELNKQ
jgi:3-deoxy-D-manno-octulosonic-acid transferase